MFKSYEELIEWLKKKKFQKRIDELAKKYKNKKILLYGAGMLAEAIFAEYDVSKLNFVNVSDMKFYSNHEDFQGITSISPYDIPEVDFDVILVAVYADAAAKEFIEDEILPDIERKVKVESFVKKSLLEKLSEFVS